MAHGLVEEKVSKIGELRFHRYIAQAELEQLGQILKDGRRFILTTHVNPDGDGLGCEVALYHALKSMGKEVHILNHSPVPSLYQFLNRDGIILQYDPNRHLPLIQQADTGFVLDIGEWERLRSVGPDLRRYRPRRLVCIDHHPSCSRISDLDIIYTQASSTGEILFLLFEQLGIEFTLDIATALYTAILTDTGGFRFTNTTVNSHYMAGFLIERGVDHIQIYKDVYENEKPAKIQLLAELLSNMHFECGRQVVWYAVTQEMLRRYGLKPEDTEGLADFPRRIAGVEVSILFMELEDGATKISFRSTGKFAIHHLAQMFNGGGHPYASGAILRRPLQDVIAQFRREICKYLEAERLQMEEKGV